MIIRALHVEHFRKFVEPVSLTGLADGVNILAECNEFGKSTLLAAIRGVLFERFSSKAQPVLAMRHWVNRTSPKITLEFELDGQLYKLEKRFLDKPYAELTLPNGAKHSNDAAEEQLQGLLHFSRAGKTGSKPEDMGMWATLWVTQRDSVDLPKFHDSARRTIHDCLDREVGALAGGTRGAALLNAVRSEIATLRNGFHKPTGRYKDVLAVLEESQAQVEDLERKQGDLSRDIEELASIDHALAQVASSGEDARLDVDLDEAKQKKELAQRYEDQEQRAKSDYALAQSRLSDLEKIADQRKTLRRQMEECGGKVAPALTTAADATKNRQTAAHALAGQNERVRLAEVAHDAAEQKMRETRALADLARQSEALELLRARLAEAEAAQESVNTLGAELLAASITEEQVKTIEVAAGNLDKACAVLEAQATLVTLNIQDDSRARLRVNGVSEWSETELRVIEDLVLEADGIGSITIRPGIKDREAQLGRQAEAERALRNALAGADVATLADARAKLFERQSWERDLAAGKNEVLRLTPADGANKVAAGMQALKDRVSTLSTALQTELAKRAMRTVPSTAVAQATLEAAEREEQQLSDAMAVARSPLPQLQQARDTAVAGEVAAQAALTSARQRSEERAAEYQQSLQHESDEALAGRRAGAAGDVLVKRGLLEQIQRDKPIESAGGMETRISRLNKAKQQFNAELIGKRQNKAILESRIEREAGIGTGEQLEEARRKKETLEHEVGRFVHELAVLDLLHKTLVDAEREAKERYMAPVVQRIIPYLQRLFPNATIRCDENFIVTGVLRAAEENFDGLSDGTQEQVAILTRLAFADMLIDSNRPAMLILDDALAYSDNARLETMFDMLTEASTRVQILVLTCREDAFRRLGGTRIRVLRSVKA